MKEIRFTELLNENDILKTFRDTKKSQSYANNAVDFLKSKDLLIKSIDSWSLKYNNPKLETLTVLGFYSLFSGSLASRDFRYYGQISDDISSLSSRILDDLGLTFSHSRDNDYLFGKNGALYSRILSLMGFFISQDGTKRKILTKPREGGAKIPKYIKRLIMDYDSINVNSRKVAKKLIRKMIYVHFDTLLRRNKPNVYLDLLSQPSKEDLFKEGIWTIDALNILYPKLKLTSDYIHPSINKEYTNGYIHIPLQEFSIAMKDDTTPLPFEVILKPKPMFRF